MQITLGDNECLTINDVPDIFPSSQLLVCLAMSRDTFSCSHFCSQSLNLLYSFTAARCCIWKVTESIALCIVYNTFFLLRMPHQLRLSQFNVSRCIHQFFFVVLEWTHLSRSAEAARAIDEVLSAGRERHFVWTRLNFHLKVVVHDQVLFVFLGILNNSTQMISVSEITMSACCATHYTTARQLKTTAAISVCNRKI